MATHSYKFMDLQNLESNHIISVQIAKRRRQTRIPPGATRPVTSAVSLLLHPLSHHKTEDGRSEVLTDPSSLYEANYVGNVEFDTLASIQNVSVCFFHVLRAPPTEALRRGSKKKKG
ncbi:hypothetical protein YC2023_081985 [Brassica napus]